MILLVTPSGGHPSARALHEATGEEVVIAESLARATTLLRAEDYLRWARSVSARSRTAGSETALEHMGTAIPVQVNLAISG